MSEPGEWAGGRICWDAGGLIPDAVKASLLDGRKQCRKMIAEREVNGLPVDVVRANLDWINRFLRNKFGDSGDGE